MNRKTFRFALPLAAAILAAACGGGGHDHGPPPVVTNPPGQNDPLDKFMAYVKDLVATALDTAEPVDVSAFDPPPTSDTKEPVATP
ncbi:hypothetical protein QTI66_07620 [Variovorax sp. J22R133]|uniref:hypothetical protein n=1 Tax=Variovorax brevis TaxID=3053503 RepID=UPI002576E8E0|nr:hypothetical protein [Variovorax sp. J22R133]MDM0112012.1 hypothetical protein [Variovorax sp. J22R133]